MIKQIVKYAVEHEVQKQSKKVFAEIKEEIIKDYKKEMHFKIDKAIQKGFSRMFRESYTNWRTMFFLIQTEDKAKEDEFYNTMQDGFAGFIEKKVESKLKSLSFEDNYYKKIAEELNKYQLVKK